MNGKCQLGSDLANQWRRGGILIPIPKPSYLDQCFYLGARNGEKRWRSKDRTKLYTWDWTHGEIEVFIKDAVAGRKIDV